MNLPDATLQAKADQVLQDLLVAIAARQVAALDATGAYWQGIMTPATPPADGAEIPPDLKRKPVGRGTSWAEEPVPLPAEIPVAVAVDVYDGPAGRGYVVRGSLVLAGVRWDRAIGVGPEDYRTTAGWLPAAKDQP